MLIADDTPALDLTVASPDDAEAVVELIHAAFAARGRLDPPPAALAETADTVRARLGVGDAVLAWVQGRPAGVVVIEPRAAGTARLQRVSVHPRFQGHGVGAAVVGAAHALCVERGFDRSELYVRDEFPRLEQWWHRLGYRRVPDGRDAAGGMLSRRLPVRVEVADAEAMRTLGARLARQLRPGDLVLLSGALGAGKTTLTQGIGAGLGVTGPVISPTFVLARVHAASSGPDLVHVDAYRLGDEAELTDLDLDSDLARSVTVVEWGGGLAEQLSDDRLEVEIDRPAASGAAEADDVRTVWLQPVGPRWDDLAVPASEREARR